MLLLTLFCDINDFKKRKRKRKKESKSFCLCLELVSSDNHISELYHVETFKSILVLSRLKQNYRVALRREVTPRLLANLVAHLMSLNV